MKRLSSTLVTLALTLGLLASSEIVLADATQDAYTTVPAGRDGIGKRYMGRDIAAVMGWQGAAWLERTEREQEERTDLLIAALNLAPGMAVADVGAGTGYLSRRMANQVGAMGKVLAVDVQPEMVRMLQAMATREGLSQVRPSLGTEKDIGLPPESIDLAVMVDVYHELAYPKEVLASIVRALKPDGRVVFVEYRGEDPSVAIKPLHKMTEQQVRLEAAAASLVWDRTIETLPIQHIVVFRKRR
jgi:SAM-dependent methyltransferase